MTKLQRPKKELPMISRNRDVSTGISGVEERFLQG